MRAGARVVSGLTFREWLRVLESSGHLSRVAREVDPHLELAAEVDRRGEVPLYFERVRGSPYTVAVGLCSRRDALALGLGVPVDGLLAALSAALRDPVAPAVVRGEASCQEVVEQVVDLSRLPVLTHLPADGGPYVTAGVAVVRDPELGRNISYHRLMRLDERRFAARLVEGRGTHAAWERAGHELEVAVCIGNSAAVLLAAAMSPEPGVDELGIANVLSPTPLVHCRTVDLEVPADAEIVLEGRITSELVEEGPFLDLTETMDIVRPQPVVEIQCCTHRRGAVYQALLPGGLEHKLLMGMPREPTIFERVNEVCQCRNLLLTPGGGSWLHAVVQIHKVRAEDGKRAIEAAFQGHGSLKHVLVVDDDIDIYNPAELEWAVATRFQAGEDLVALTDQPGSSLDPSGRHLPGLKSRTDKMGLDATVPWTRSDGSLRSAEERATFAKIRYSPVEKPA